MPDVSLPPISLGVQRLNFELIFTKGGQVSRNWGPTLRGGFGRALRQVACSTKQDSCKDCFLATSCPYGYVFETPIIDSGGIMQKYTNAPHPFVFEPNEAKPRVQSGDSLWNSLVVIGDAIRYLPYFFLALQELGRAGLGKDEIPFEIRRVEIESGAVLYNRDAGPQFRPATLMPLPIEPGASQHGRFTLEFRTATRLVTDGRLNSEPTLENIIKGLCRRVFLLRHFHCGGNGQAVPTAFIEAAVQSQCVHREMAWTDANRFSTRQQRQVPIGGFLGSITCEGDIGLLRPLLRIGEYVHVGKNVTFGLGKFVLSEESETS